MGNEGSMGNAERVGIPTRPGGKGGKSDEGNTAKPEIFYVQLKKSRSQ